MADTITVLVNGERRQLDAAMSVQDLLEVLGLDPAGVVVEVNHEIVRRPRLEQVRLAEGDAVELVHFVGGG